MTATRWSMMDTATMATIINYAIAWFVAVTVYLVATTDMVCGRYILCRYFLRMSLHSLVMTVHTE